MPVSDVVIEQRATRAVSNYIKHHRDDAARELHFYRSMPSLARAIHRGARARTADGGKHPHQWRIPRGVLRTFGARLARREQALSEAASLDELHNAVGGVGGPISRHRRARGVRHGASNRRVARPRARASVPAPRDPGGGGGCQGRTPALHHRRLPTALTVRAPRTTRDRRLPLHLQGTPVGQAIPVAHRLPMQRRGLRSSARRNGPSTLLTRSAGRSWRGLWPVLSVRSATRAAARPPTRHDPG